MVLNLGIIALAALMPILVGFVWYNPKVFGNAWMKACGFKEEDLKGANMPLIFILSYVFSFILGTMVTMVVVHQNHFFSLIADTPEAMVAGNELNDYMLDFMNRFGDKFRTFKHGAFHGIMTSIFFVLPVVGTNALFERKGFKYIAIHVGYWMVSLALMGGIICQFS